MNTLITVTVQKTRENEGIGASLWQIVWMFLVQGMVVGNRRHVLRLARGMMLIRYRNEFRQWLANTLGIEVFPRQICQFSQIPAEVIPGDVAKISIIDLSSARSPRLSRPYQAARLDPVMALRFE